MKNVTTRTGHYQIRLPFREEEEEASSSQNGFQIVVMSCQRSRGRTAPHTKDLDLKSDNLPLDKALGIHWDVERDTIDFVFSERDS